MTVKRQAPDKPGGCNYSSLAAAIVDMRALTLRSSFPRRLVPLALLFSELMRKKSDFTVIILRICV
jgi:hypothetical protein